jgi:hypothetical protein
MSQDSIIFMLNITSKKLVSKKHETKNQRQKNRWRPPSF